MSYLMMDEDGNVYVGATHRSDAQGVECLPEEAQDFSDPMIQNPYLKQEQQAGNESKALAAYNVMSMGHEDQARKIQTKRNKKRKNLEALAIESRNHNQNELLSEALLQHMNGADFDQLSITDAQYGQKHAAILQGMGEAAQDSDLKYIQNAEYVSPIESEQSKLSAYANSQIMSQAQAQAIASEKEFYEKPTQSLLDTQAQALLEGEINFANEDEAAQFMSMTEAQKIAFLKAQALGPEVLASTSEASAVAKKTMDKRIVYGGLALLAYALLK